MISSVALFWIVAGLIASYSSQDLKLTTTFLIYRHGDRSPVWFYPTDMHKDYWPSGLGQLSKLGMRQEYQLGTEIRAKYINTLSFLNESYRREDIYIRSTDVDRTLMSAQSVLAGLYPPNGTFPIDQLWNKHLNWQPIPVHTIPITEDYLLNAGGSCPLFKKMENNIWRNDPNATQINQDFKQIFKMLENKTGVQPFSLGSLDYFVDSLICQVSHNLTLPDWLNASLINAMFSLHNLRFQLNYKYEKMQTLATGSLLKDMFTVMDYKEEQYALYGQDQETHFQINRSDIDFRAGKTALNYTSHKFFMFSAHDTTLTALLSALDSFALNPEISFPYYSAAIFIEFYRNISDGVLFVKLLYRNTPLTYHKNIGIIKNYTITQIVLPGCEKIEFCPYKTFKASLASRLPIDIASECSANYIVSYCNASGNNWVTCYMIVPFLACCALFIPLWILVTYLMRKRRMALAQDPERRPLTGFHNDNTNNIQQNVPIYHDDDDFDIENNNRPEKISTTLKSENILTNTNNATPIMSDGYTPLPTVEY